MEPLLLFKNMKSKHPGSLSKKFYEQIPVAFELMDTILTKFSSFSRVLSTYETKKNYR